MPKFEKMPLLLGYLGYCPRMATRQPLKLVVDGLPHRCDDSLEVIIPDACLKTNVQPSDRYVWPDLLTDSKTIDSPVVLISAPGAMGKSMAAKAVAAELNAPYIDLSRLSVGSDTLTGLLARVLGWTQTPELIRDMRSGEAAIVLDGLDEAQLRAGREHTIAFLENIVELLRNSNVSVGQIILFGRRDAMETCYLVFNENNVCPFVAHIAPLTRAQANELIDLELDHRKIDGRPYRIHRTYRIPFAEMRDNLFKEIASSLITADVAVEANQNGDYWPEVEDFLGYPPVLLVFAERLAVSNPTTSRSSIQSSASPLQDQQGDLLRKILEGILDRERDKVREQLAQALGLEAENPKCSLLYTREEQILRILDYKAGLSLDLLPPLALSDDQRSIYNDQLSTFVPDHPFLRDRDFANIVFADYVRAFVAIDPRADAYGASKIEMLQACLLPGPFFAGLVHSLIPRKGAEAILPSEDLVDDLIKSYYMGSAENPSFIYTHNAEHAHLSLHDANMWDKSSIHQVNSGLFFHITEPSGVLVLTTPLFNGMVVSNYGLVLKSPSDEVALGPGFFCMVDELQMVGHALTALGRHYGQQAATSDEEELVGVMLLAKQRIEHDPALAIHCYPAEALSVYWPNAWHMWRPYLFNDFDVPDKGKPEFQPAMAYRWQIALGARRILTSFRGTTNDPSVNREWIDRFTTGSNPVFVAVLDGLVELGVVERDVSSYRLRLAVLGDYGVSYAAIRGAEFVKALSDLSTALYKTEVVQDAIKNAGDG